jgi:hypothetical protein
MFSDPKVKYLLQFQNPLMVVSDYILPLKDVTDFSSIMRDITDKRDLLHSGEYVLMNVTAETSMVEKAAGRKQSLLGDLDEKRKDVKPPDTPSADKKKSVELTA